MPSNPYLYLARSIGKPYAEVLAYSESLRRNDGELVAPFIADTPSLSIPDMFAIDNVYREEKRRREAVAKEDNMVAHCQRDSWRDLPKRSDAKLTPVVEAALMPVGVAAENMRLRAKIAELEAEKKELERQLDAIYE